MQNLGTKNYQSDIPTMGDIDRAYAVYQQFLPYRTAATATGCVMSYVGNSGNNGEVIATDGVLCRTSYGFAQTAPSVSAVAGMYGSNTAPFMTLPSLYQSNAYIPGALATIPTHRFAMGIITNAPTTDVNPSTFLNCIILACDSTDTTVQIMHNDTSGTCTKIDTGWLKPTTAKQYRFYLELKSDPISQSVTYKAKRWSASFAEDTFSGSLTTNIPTKSIFGFFCLASAGGTSSTAQVNLGHTILKSWDA